MGESVMVDSDLTEPGTALRSALSGLLVVALAAGTFLLTSEDRDVPYPDALGHVSSLYAEGAEALLAATDLRSVEVLGITVGDLQPQLEGLLATGVQPVSEDLVTIAGVPLMSVTDGQGVQWCVRPDGVLLLLCAFGGLDVQMTSTDVSGTVTVTAQELGLNRNGGLVEVHYQPASEEKVTLLGTPVLTGEVADWTLDGYLEVVGVDGREPTGSIDFGGDTSIVFLLTSPFDPSGNLAGASFDIAFENATIHVRIPRPTYWFD